MSMPAESTAPRSDSPTPVTLVPKPSRAPQPPKRRSSRTWVLVGLLAILVLGGAFVTWRWSNATPTVRYTEAAVARGDITRTVAATGSVNPMLTIIIGSYVSGTIKEVHCDYNTQVKQGQVCAKIDPSPYQTVADQNRANLAVAKAQREKDMANLAYAQLTYERKASLAQTSSVSKDSLDSAKNALDQAMAQIGVDDATIQQRQAQLAAAEVNLGYTDIASPVDGTVVSRNVTIGQTVAASFQTPTLFLIATDLTKMQVDANVSESDIGGIKAGNKATFTVDAFQRRSFEGAVSQVRQSPQTVQNVVTYDVVVNVDNSSLSLKPGMTASTRIVIDQRRDVLRVPSQSLRYAPAGTPRTASTGARNQGRVWVLRDAAPVAIPVTIGLDDDSFVEIVSGDIKAGDKVIVSEQSGSSTNNRSAPPVPRF